MRRPGGLALLLLLVVWGAVSVSCKSVSSNAELVARTSCKKRRPKGVQCPDEDSLGLLGATKKCACLGDCRTVLLRCGNGNAWKYAERGRDSCDVTSFHSSRSADPFAARYSIVEGTYTYSCSAGYQLVGEQVQTCKNGSLSGAAPTCAVQDRATEVSDTTEDVIYTITEHTATPEVSDTSSQSHIPDVTVTTADSNVNNHTVEATTSTSAQRVTTYIGNTSTPETFTISPLTNVTGDAQTFTNYNGDTSTAETFTISPLTNVTGDAQTFTNYNGDTSTAETFTISPLTKGAFPHAASLTAIVSSLVLLTMMLGVLKYCSKRSGRPRRTDAESQNHSQWLRTDWIFKLNKQND